MGAEAGGWGAGVLGRRAGETPAPQRRAAVGEKVTRETSVKRLECAVFQQRFL